MVTFESGNKKYEGETVDEVAKLVLADNKLNNKSRKHKPFPEDYAAIYRSVIRANRTAEQRARNIKVSNQRRKDKVRKKQPLTFAETMSGARAIVKLAKGKIVKFNEMQRRAAICGKCPLVDRNSGCTTCTAGAAVSSAIDHVKRLAGGGIKYPAIPNHGRPKDFYCGHCGCSMLTILPSKMECFEGEKPEENEARPSYCWIRQDSENFQA